MCIKYAYTDVKCGLSDARWLQEFTTCFVQTKTIRQLELIQPQHIHSRQLLGFLLFGKKHQTLFYK